MKALIIIAVMHIPLSACNNSPPMIGEDFIKNYTQETLVQPGSEQAKYLELRGLEKFDQPRRILTSKTNLTRLQGAFPIKSPTDPSVVKFEKKSNDILKIDLSVFNKPHTCVQLSITNKSHESLLMNYPSIFSYGATHWSPFEFYGQDGGTQNPKYTGLYHPSRGVPSMEKMIELKPKKETLFSYCLGDHYTLTKNIKMIRFNNHLRIYRPLENGEVEYLGDPSLKSNLLELG